MSETLGRRCINVIQMFCVWWERCRRGPTSNQPESNPINTRSWTNVGIMLAHRLRRWPDIKPTLGQRLLFNGKSAARCLSFRISRKYLPSLSCILPSAGGRFAVTLRGPCTRNWSMKREVLIPSMFFHIERGMVGLLWKQKHEIV